MNPEGSLFLLTLKSEENEIEVEERVISMRTSEVYIDGEQRKIILIREVTD
jgi:hypothetical protein